MHIVQIGMHHFYLIGRHLESGSRTELIFELNLAPSEERLICELVIRSQVATFVPGLFLFCFLSVPILIVLRSFMLSLS